MLSQSNTMTAEHHPWYQQNFTSARVEQTTRCNFSESKSISFSFTSALSSHSHPTSNLKIFFQINYIEIPLICRYKNTQNNYTRTSFFHKRWLCFLELSNSLRAQLPSYSKCRYVPSLIHGWPPDHFFLNNTTTNCDSPNKNQFSINNIIIIIAHEHVQA